MSLYSGNKMYLFTYSDDTRKSITGNPGISLLILIVPEKGLQVILHMGHMFTLILVILAVSI